MTPELRAYFDRRGWTPFAFQTEVWERYARGESGLIHSATGTGKTLAAWGGPLMAARNDPDRIGLRVLWITPLRALAADTATALTDVGQELGLDWRVETRTGDTPAAVRTKQRKRLPQAMVTTPESASVLMANPAFPELVRDLDAVIVDEWHELLSTKRGTQTELFLARVRALRPEVRVWGLSATLGNMEEALQTLVGAHGVGHLVRGESDKEVVIDSLLPPVLERFPWAGHFGGQMVGPVCEALAEGGSALLFCNTRAMAELWFRNILLRHPEWENEVGLHHGSLDRAERERVEAGLKSGALKTVVATSSLDLGVDFHPVDRVFQIGSPKSVARLIQRAGRSGHRPGFPSRVTLVPTHALELVDITAARFAAHRGQIEARRPLRNPLDVLAQHMVTVAAGPGWTDAELQQEARSTVAFQTLSDADWEWTKEFVMFGGPSLRAYPEFQRVTQDERGVYRVASEQIAKAHRLQIGTIVSDSAVTVKFLRGATLGTLDESFAARLRPGDAFLFGGRALECVRMADMTVYVTQAGKSPKLTPKWSGSRLPLSGPLATAIWEELGCARNGELRSEEMRYLAPILALQAKWSAIPGEDETLLELFEDREGHHLFLYPFAGRLVHEGLAALLALRISRLQPITLSLAANDYGLELLAPVPIPWEEAIDRAVFSVRNLEADVMEALNSGELARRQFREVARVAGLVNEGYPGRGKTARQIQASSGLLYDVFARYDSDNLLLVQARREVMERQLDLARLRLTLRRLENHPIVVTRPPKPTPLAFPILVDRLRETVSSESLADRVARLTAELERAAGP